MESIIFSTATDLTHAIRTGRISAVEVVEAHLEQIAHHNSKLNAIVTLDEEGALKAARQADDALTNGDILGPLHGVPITLKDIHSVAGLRCTSGGYPPLANHVPSTDSVVVSRLRNAGAIILGITNMYFWNDSIYGKSNNPWNTERSPGTSSSGAVAAVAAGLSTFDIGSDLSGSITVPAHYTGVFGMRPTEGRVPMNGVVERKPVFIWHIFNVLGPITRSAKDLQLALQVISNNNGVYGPPVPWQSVPKPEIHNLRIAWVPTFGEMKIREEIRTQVERLADNLAERGAHVEQTMPSINIQAQKELCNQLLGYLFRAFDRDRNTIPDLLEDFFLDLAARDAYIEQWERFFERWDILLTPVWGITAHLHTETQHQIDGEELDYMEIGGPYLPPILTGHPVVTMPLGRDAQGLPFGLLVIGPRWQDERLLAIVEALEDFTGGFVRPPGY